MASASIPAVPGVLASEIGYRQDDPSQWPTYKPAHDDTARTARTAMRRMDMSDLQAAVYRWFWEGTLPEVYKAGLYNGISGTSRTDFTTGRRIHQNYLLYASINQAIFRESPLWPGILPWVGLLSSVVTYSPENVSPLVLADHRRPALHGTPPDARQG